MKGHRDWVQNAYFINDDSNIFTEAGDSSVILWDLSGNIISQFNLDKGWVNSSTVNEKSEILAIGYSDGFIGVWDLQTGNLKYQIDNNGCSVNLI